MSAADTTTAESRETTEIRPFEPVLGDRFVLAWPHLVLTCWFCGLFLILSHLPLVHTELWGHITAGNEIILAAELPQNEPSLSLAEGMPYASPTWLSQITLASVNNVGGADALSGLLALIQLFALLAFSFAIYFRTTKKRYALAAAVGLVAVSFAFSTALLPRVFGGVCLASMLLILALLPQWNGFASKSAKKKGEWPIWVWFAVPALFAIWANFDISFVAGLLVLVCIAIGRIVDVVRKTSSLLTVLIDRQTRRMVVLAELAAIATLVNPYGWNLWGYAVGSGVNSFWVLAGGWHPLVLASLTGLGFVAIWLIAIACIRFSTATWRSEEVLLLASFSLAVACNEQLIVWFAPVAGFILFPRIREMLESSGVFQMEWMQRIEASAVPALASEGDAERRPLRFAYSLCSVLVVWIAFALSPLSNPLFGGDPRSPDHQFSTQTPLGVANYLAELQPDTLIWAPSYWGDFLNLNAKSDPGYFANSNLRVLPAQAQLDFDHIRRAGPGTNRLLGRYNVGVIVVDVTRQKDLSAVIKANTTDWRLAYQDDQAAVYISRKTGFPKAASETVSELRLGSQPNKTQLALGGIQ